MASDAKKCFVGYFFLSNFNHFKFFLRLKPKNNFSYKKSLIENGEVSEW